MSGLKGPVRGTFGEVGKVNLYRAVWFDTVISALIPVTSWMEKYPGVALTEPSTIAVARSPTLKPHLLTSSSGQVDCGNIGKLPIDGD